jgi:6-pyruvoyltetrahydropterin/6-carboxytetrahydropterin synthase
MIRMTRRYKFSASHRLHCDALNEAANRDLYGKCNNPYGHGHNYVLEVTVRGPLNIKSGQIANVRLLDTLVSRAVIHDFDNKNLNADIVEFGSSVPTSENITNVIVQRLDTHWKTAFPGEWPVLDRVLLRETRKNSFELRHVAS